MRFLRADSAVTVHVGPFVDATDGYTMETGLVTPLASDNVGLIKHNTTVDVDISSRTFTEIDSVNMPGWYAIGLLATDVDTEGHLTIGIQDPGGGYLPLKFEFMVMNANAFDSLFESAGTDYLDVNVEQVNGQNVLGAGTSGDKWRG